MVRRYFPFDRLSASLIPEKHLRNLVRIILLALLGVGALATPAGATPGSKPGNTLGRLWTTALET
ncbi:hypothetical protein ACQ7B2_07440, partial [Escherichia coli]